MYLTHYILAPACLLQYTNTEFSLSFLTETNYSVDKKDKCSDLA